MSVGKVTTQINDDMEVTQLQAPMKHKHSDPITLNVNVNICTPAQTVVPAASYATVVAPPFLVQL